MPTPLIPCEFFLIRYVPDVVKGEFTNIGVLLREAELKVANPVPRLRFTRDWSRVRCMHADVDTDLLEALEGEILYRLQTETGRTDAYPKTVMDVIGESFSNSIQISEPRVSLAVTLIDELEQLMRLYVEPIRAPLGAPKLRLKSAIPLSGRTGIFNSMRSAFEKAGVWEHMRKRIPVSQYTRTGDPMRLDCAYRPNGVVRAFHAISLKSDVEAAKSLAFSAPLLRNGFKRLDEAELDLAAIVEPIRSVSPRSADDEAAELYKFGVSTMESAGIRVLTINNLAAAAEHARLELRL